VQPEAADFATKIFVKPICLSGRARKRKRRNLPSPDIAIERDCDNNQRHAAGILYGKDDDSLSVISNGGAGNDIVE